MSTEIQQDCERLLDAVSAAKNEYLSDYEMVVENEEGAEGYYKPTDREKMLIKDAIDGLLADEDFVVAYDAWREAVRNYK